MFDSAYTRCECGSIMFIPLMGDPEISSPTITPEAGHEHTYKPFNPLMERFDKIDSRLERIEQHLGIVAKGGG